MNTLSQIVAVTSVNLRSLPQRLGSSLVIVLGIAGVVAVMISMLATSEGVIKTMQNAGREDHAIVLRYGAVGEYTSHLDLASTNIIAEAPGVKRDLDGKSIVSVEMLRLITAHKKEDDSAVNTTIRGIGLDWKVVHPEIKLIEGRMFQPAVNELIVGKRALGQLKNMDIGSKVETPLATWTVVGTFESDGDFHESELITDTSTLASAYRVPDFSSVTVVLDSPGSFQQFKDALSTNPAVSVDVLQEREYLSRQSKEITTLLWWVANVVGGIMALGAFLGAMNAMYSAVSSRMREVATLRAIGFGALAPLTSILVESMLLATLGGVIGALLAWVFFNGNTATTGVEKVTLVFDLSVSWDLVVRGITWACAIGFIGGIFPAIRAARLPVATSLRS